MVFRLYSTCSEKQPPAGIVTDEPTFSLEVSITRTRFRSSTIVISSHMPTQVLLCWALQMRVTAAEQFTLCSSIENFKWTGIYNCGVRNHDFWWVLIHAQQQKDVMPLPQSLSNSIRRRIWKRDSITHQLLQAVASNFCCTRTKAWTPVLAYQKRAQLIIRQKVSAIGRYWQMWQINSTGRQYRDAGLCALRVRTVSSCTELAICINVLKFCLL
jgi:hypothetical protein